MAGRKRRTVETDLFAEEPPAPPKDSDVLRVDIPEEQVEEVRKQIHEALENSDEVPTITVSEKVAVEKPENEEFKTEICEKITKIEEKKPEKPPMRIPAMPPTEEMHEFTGNSVTDEDLYKELVGILSPQKGKRAVPTKIRFWSRYAQAWRHVIIDVNEYLLADAYKCWLTHGKTDDEEFLDHVYKITKVDVPRMFRVVADLDLETLRAKHDAPKRI